MRCLRPSASGPGRRRTFLLGLAVLSLLADAAEKRPLICVVDDEQWLDRASAHTLAFAARRLDAESVALLFAARMPGEELDGLPGLEVQGLREADARRRLESVLAGPLDDRIRDRIVSEARGNPLAPLELPRDTAPGQLAGGFGLPGAMSLSGRLEQRLRRQLDALPSEPRRLLQIAAADRVPIPRWSGLPRSGSRSRPTPPRPRSTLVWSSSARGCASATPWCDRRRTAQRRHENGRRCTAPSPRSSTRRWILTAAPGTGRKPRRCPTKRWPASSSTRPLARRRAAGWRPQRRSSSAPQRSRPNHDSGRGDCSRRLAPTATPAARAMSTPSRCSPRCGRTISSFQAA